MTQITAAILRKFLLPQRSAFRGAQCCEVLAAVSAVFEVTSMVSTIHQQDVRRQRPVAIYRATMHAASCLREQLSGVAPATTSWVILSSGYARIFIFGTGGGRW